MTVLFEYEITCIVCKEKGILTSLFQEYELGGIVEDSACNTCGAEGVITGVLDSA